MDIKHMYFDEIIEVLYGNDYEKILLLLNHSTFVENINEKSYRFLSVIHSGFVFKTQDGTKMELLILWDGFFPIILWQKQNKYFPIPQVLGLNLYEGKINNKRFSRYLFEIYTSSEAIGDRFYWGKSTSSFLGVQGLKCGILFLEEIRIRKDLYTMIYIPDPNNYYIPGPSNYMNKILITSFKFIKNGKIIKESPLHRELDKIVYFNGNSFTKYLTESEQKNRIIKKEDYSEYEEEVEFEDIDFEDEPIRYQETYGKYSGTWAQDVEGLSDNFIDDVLDGNPEAYWNID